MFGTQSVTGRWLGTARPLVARPLLLEAGSCPVVWDAGDAEGARRTGGGSRACELGHRGVPAALSSSAEPGRGGAYFPAPQRHSPQTSGSQCPARVCATTSGRVSTSASSCASAWRAWRVRGDPGTLTTVRTPPCAGDRQRLLSLSLAVGALPPAPARFRGLCLDCHVWFPDWPQAS